MIDPEQAVRRVGFDITSLSVAEFAQRGIRLDPHITVGCVSKTDRRWLSHSEADARYPARLEHARATARMAAAWYVTTSEDGVRGLTLSRSFPCLGIYRAEPAGAAAQTGPVVVVCDTCGDRVGVRRDEFDEALLAPPLS